MNLKKKACSFKSRLSKCVIKVLKIFGTESLNPDNNN